MENGAGDNNNRPSSSGPATLNEVLCSEFDQLRPSQPNGIAAKTLADPAAERTANLRAIYTRSHAASLTALCLSGGGIRSATFNLGVLQSLAKIGLLGKFDYLSSVSGGGYIAVWLRAWMARVNIAGVIKALNPEPSRDPLAPEPVPVVNLRNYSNYLTPHLGLFSGDTWAAAAIIARNLLLNWLVLVPLLAAITGIPLLFRLVVHGTGIPESLHRYLLCAALVIELVASLLVYSFRRFAKRPGIPQGYFVFCCVLPIWLAAGVLCTAALGLNLQNSMQHPCCSDLTGLWEFSLVWCVVVPFIGWLAAEILAWFFPGWTRPAPDAPPEQIRQVTRWCELLGLLVSGAVGALLLVLVVTHGFATFYLHPDAYVILGLPILLGIYLISRALFVAIASLGGSSRQRGPDDDADREWWARLSGWVLLVMTAWTVVTGICLFGLYLAGLFDRYPVGVYPSKSFIDGVKAFVAGLGTLSGVIAAFTGSSAKTPANANARIGPPPALMQLLVQAAGVVFLICVIIMLTWGLKSLGQWSTDESHLFSDPMSWQVWGQFLLLILGLAAFSVLASLPVNVNRFSLHGMYRNRLVRAYLGASNDSDVDGQQRQADPFTGFALSDNLRLNRLFPQPPASGAPNAATPASEARLLPIINTTLNLVHGEDLAWQQRKAESFSMTPLYCGNWVQGYRRSTEYGRRDGITVGTAMTISGAAANPNMGYNSSPVLAFLMSIFNVRLGAWLGNTNAKGDKTYRRPGPRLALKPLFFEMLGLTNARCSHVNLSDGGHFDNLGLYEVVLRRCRHVLVSDAGNDGSFAFEDLGNAIRKIRIDFGIPIEFKTRIEILPNEPEDSGKPSRPGLYCAIADICYSAIDGDVPDGKLIYIKPTLRGHVPKQRGGGVPYDIYSYARSSKDFPHESTVDQWFSESQFESYRALGSHILEQLAGPLKDASFGDFLKAAGAHIDTARAPIDTARTHTAETKP